MISCPPQTTHTLTTGRTKNGTQTRKRIRLKPMIQREQNVHRYLEFTACLAFVLLSGLGIYELFCESQECYENARRRLSYHDDPDAYERFKNGEKITYSLYCRKARQTILASWPTALVAVFGFAWKSCRKVAENAIKDQLKYAEKKEFTFWYDKAEKKIMVKFESENWGGEKEGVMIEGKLDKIGQPDKLEGNSHIDNHKVKLKFTCNDGRKMCARWIYYNKGDKEHWRFRYLLDLAIALKKEFKTELDLTIGNLLRRRDGTLLYDEAVDGFKFKDSDDD